jgi:hypothetical protein
MLHGQCHCGAVQFDMPDQAVFSTLCNCQDCRSQSGSPVVAWAMVPIDQVAVEGAAKVYNSSETGRRSFCGECGTNLFFTSGPLEKMGMMQVRIAVLDNPEAIAPVMQVQTAEQIKWMASAHELPFCQRFPKP